MFRWNMSLESGARSIDMPRRQLVEAMADFFQILDDPKLSQSLVAERTGGVFTTMKAAFAAEDKFLSPYPEEERSRHQATHSGLILAYVDLCKKLVPRIKSVKQGQQACLEIYGFVDHILYKHLTDEVLGYKHLLRAPASSV